MKPPIHFIELHPDSSTTYLVWSVGRYANGHALVELRAVCTSRKYAYEKAEMIQDEAEFAVGPLVVFWERIEIEGRLQNHLYGAQMKQLSEQVAR